MKRPHRRVIDRLRAFLPGEWVYDAAIWGWRYVPTGREVVRQACGGVREDGEWESAGYCTIIWSDTGEAIFTHPEMLLERSKP